jgi:hypothetical protein
MALTKRVKRTPEISCSSSGVVIAHLGPLKLRLACSLAGQCHRASKQEGETDGPEHYVLIVFADLTRSCPASVNGTEVPDNERPL